MILIKDNKIVVCDEKDKQMYINDGYSVVSNKKAPATANKKTEDGKNKNDGKKIEGDLENL